MVIAPNKLSFCGSWTSEDTIGNYCASLNKYHENCTVTQGAYKDLCANCVESENLLYKESLSLI